MLPLRLLVPLMLGSLAVRSLAQGPPDPKRMLDLAMDYVAEQQNDDGTYGPKDQRVKGTARVLQAFGSCPRRYTEEDGPLVRKAAQVPYTIVLLNWAAVSGLYHYLRGYSGTWESAQ